MPKKGEVGGTGGVVESGGNGGATTKKVKLAEITKSDPAKGKATKEYVVPELEGVTQFRGIEIYYYYGKKADKNGVLSKVSGKEVEVLGLCVKRPETLKISEVTVAP